MANDYTKVCWSCGSREVFPIKDWYECQSCGATYVPQPQPHFAPDVIVDAETGRAPRPGRPTERRVSGHVARSAEKHREKQAALPDK